MIRLIVACGENRVIGKENKLPWNLPRDLAYFKKVTTGHVILMGRKTYESIGKPLPNRVNIVLSRSMLKSNNAEYFFQSEGNLLVTQGMDIVYKYATARDIYIIGGADIYNQFLNLADEIYMTQVHGEFEGDTYFPELGEGDWEEVHSEFHPADDKNSHDVTFKVLKKTF